METNITLIQCSMFSRGEGKEARFITLPATARDLAESPSVRIKVHSPERLQGKDLEC